MNMSDVCNVTTTPAEHHEIGDTLEDKCEHETTVATGEVKIKFKRKYNPRANIVIL